MTNSPILSSGLKEVQLLINNAKKIAEKTNSETEKNDIAKDLQRIRDARLEWKLLQREKQKVATLQDMKEVVKSIPQITALMKESYEESNSRHVNFQNWLTAVKEKNVNAYDRVYTNYEYRARDGSIKTKKKVIYIKSEKKTISENERVNVNVKF